MKPIIKLANVSFSYPEAINVINNIDLNIYTGQIISVIGSNGSGKTTLAKLLNGLLIPSEGTITIDNIEINSSSNLKRELRKKVGIVFQNPDNQIFANTIEDDIAFGLENYGVNPKEIRMRVDKVLKNINLYKERFKEPQYLSGGQKQKVAIAGILAMEPKVIILDEAISMLDPKGKENILMLCKLLSEREEIAIINITNNIQETLFSERVIVLDEGKVLLDDSPINVFNERNLLIKIGLEVPIIVELAHRLINKGYLDKDIQSEEEFLKNLWTLF